MTKYRDMSPVDAINTMLADMRALLGRSGRSKRSYLYFSIPKNWEGMRYQFGYTPWKTRFEGKTGFFAVCYRVTKKGLVLKWAVRFGKRKTARARAQKWFDAYYHNEGKTDG